MWLRGAKQCRRLPPTSKLMYAINEVLKRQCCGRGTHAFSGKSTQPAASLKCLCMGNKQEELEACVQQDYSIIGVTERWWDSSRSWSAAMAGLLGSLGRAGQGDEEKDLPFTWESRENAWISALGWIMNQLRFYGLGLEERPNWVIRWWLFATDYLRFSWDNWQNSHFHRS